MSETNSPAVATVDPASAAALPSLAMLGGTVAPNPMVAIDAGSVVVAATPAVDPSPAVADPAPVAAVAEPAAEPAPLAEPTGNPAPADIGPAPAAASSAPVPEIAPVAVDPVLAAASNNVLIEGLTMPPSPYVGETVLFRPDGRGANSAGEYVAIIGQVHGDSGFVSLITFPPFREPRWEGSVCKDDGTSQPRSWRSPGV